MDRIILDDLSLNTSDYEFVNSTFLRNKLTERKTINRNKKMEVKDTEKYDEV